MAEQPVNLSTAIYLGVFSRAEQRVLQAIFKAISEGAGRCVATLAMLARASNTSKPTTRNAIAQAVAIGLSKRPSAALTALSRFPTFELREALMVPQGADVGVYVRDAKLRESSESYVVVKILRPIDSIFGLRFFGRGFSPVHDSSAKRH